MSVAETAAAARLPWDPADPYPFYEQCRAEGDVVWDATAQAWLVVGYRAARQVLGEPGLTSDPRHGPGRAAISLLGSDLVDRSMLLTDGANHRDVYKRQHEGGPDHLDDRPRHDRQR